MKKTLKILSIILIIIIVINICIFSLVNNNQKYFKNILKNIEDNYQIKEKITYLNIYNNYYIFTTKNKVIVLNNEYQEILNEPINTITKKKKNQELIYKTNQLMFEETILKKDHLIYKYYDATNGEFIKKTVLENK